MTIYLMEWLSLCLKFLHVITGIAWIGASFYFNWLENQLDRTKGQKQGIAGHLWAVHGGGFYYLEKYKKYPEHLPQKLHWFKWEAYFTWMSGVLLLATIYYFNASTYLLTSDSSLSGTQGVLLSIAGLIIAWVLYDLLCKSAIVKKPVLMLIIMFVFVSIASYFYHQFFNPRAAYMQIGAMIGTIMVANVFFVIIPVQKILVSACKNKTDISLELGFKGYVRSRHNNYLTLPVLFIMISGHYPIIYSSSYAWAVLIAAIATSFVIRHYFNLAGANKKAAWSAVLASVMLLALVITLAPINYSDNQIIKFSRVKEIINNRCVSCHAKEPSDNIFTTAPMGFMLDSDEKIIKAKNQIYTQSVISNAMPFLNNKTKMTAEERKELGIWFEQKKDE